MQKIQIVMHGKYRMLRWCYFKKCQNRKIHYYNSNKSTDSKKNSGREVNFHFLKAHLGNSKPIVIHGILHLQSLNLLTHRTSILSILDTNIGFLSQFFLNGSQLGSFNIIFLLFCFFNLLL